MIAQAITADTLLLIAVVSGIIALIALGVAAWAVTSAQKSRSAGSPREVGSLRQELQSLQEKYTMFNDRFDRHERTLQNLRDDITHVRNEVSSRRQRIDELDKVTRDQQEQIFELRQEHKLMMERDDRIERRQRSSEEERRTVSTDSGDSRNTQNS